MFDLADAPLFSGLTAAELDRALDFFSASERVYARSEALHRAGDRLRRFGLVLEGTVQVYMDDISGQRMIMANVTEGETFGESLCFLGVEDAPVNICCTGERTRVLWLRADGLFASSDPRDRELCRRFTAMLARRALSMNDRIQILSKKTLRERLVAYFTECAHRAGSQSFTVPLDRSDMAAYLGADRSALSRELSKMQRDGMIEYSRSFFRIL